MTGRKKIELVRERGGEDKREIDREREKGNCCFFIAVPSERYIGERPFLFWQNDFELFYICSPEMFLNKMPLIWISPNVLIIFQKWSASSNRAFY